MGPARLWWETQAEAAESRPASTRVKQRQRSPGPVAAVDSPGHAQQTGLWRTPASLYTRPDLPGSESCLFRFLILLPVLFLACPLPITAAGEVQTALQAVDRESAAALRTLAAWCQKQKLYGKRDEALEVLLQYAPDDEKARRRLKFKREDDGTWTRSARYKRPPNLSRAGLDEADARLADIRLADTQARVAAHAEARSLADIAEARRVLAGMRSLHPSLASVAAAERTLALRYYGMVADRGLLPEVRDTTAWLEQNLPADLEVRSTLGLVEREGRLVLAESARALADEAGFLAAAATAAEAKVEPDVANAYEKKIELPWSTPQRTEHLRVAGTAAPKGLAAVARACEGAGSFFERGFGRPPVRRKDLILYVFSKKGEREVFLSGYPVQDNPTLRLRKKLDLVYADGQTLAIRNILPAAQLDLAVNEVLNQMISETFLQNAVPRAWHAEGLARYLAWRGTGTRYAINVSGSYAGQSKDRAIPDTKADWLAKARAYLAKGPADLQTLLGKGTDVFTVRDALVAYAFSVYLLEGHPGLGALFLTSHHQTKDVDRTCREVLGYRRVLVEERLVRWLDEVIAGRTPR